MSDVPLYPSSGDGVQFDPEEVLGRSQGPTVGRMSLLATYRIHAARGHRATLGKQSHTGLPRS